MRRLPGWLHVRFVPEGIELDPEALERIRARAGELRAVPLRRSPQDDSILPAGRFVRVVLAYAGLIVGSTVLAVLLDLPAAMSFPVHWLAIVLLTPTIVRMTVAPRWRMALREAGYDVCVRCGYVAGRTGAATEACPECGLDHARFPIGERVEVPGEPGVPGAD